MLSCKFGTCFYAQNKQAGERKRRQRKLSASETLTAPKYK
jgi:hypothetical protein